MAFEPPRRVRNCIPSEFYPLSDFKIYPDTFWKSAGDPNVLQVASCLNQLFSSKWWVAAETKKCRRGYGMGARSEDCLDASLSEEAEILTSGEIASVRRAFELFATSARSRLSTGTLQRPPTRMVNLGRQGVAAMASGALTVTASMVMFEGRWSWWCTLKLMAQHCQVSVSTCGMSAKPYSGLNHRSG